MLENERNKMNDHNPLLDLIPGVGEYYDVKAMYQNPSLYNAAMIGLDVAGYVPFIGWAAKAAKAAKKLKRVSDAVEAAGKTYRYEQRLARALAKIDASNAVRFMYGAGFLQVPQVVQWGLDSRNQTVPIGSYKNPYRLPTITVTPK